MPLPLILGLAAAGAAVGGAVSGVKGAKKMSDAKYTMDTVERRHGENIENLEITSEETVEVMDRLGVLQLETLESFEYFSDTIEKINNRPTFKGYTEDGVKIPSYNAETIKKASIGAGVLLGGLGGAAAGTAGGVAAAGATTSVVMALGTASTGTAIGGLSGAAASNAVLAFLGGGSLAAGGGGMALGSMILGGATLGVGLLVGGAIFNLTGGKLSDQADEAWREMKKAEKQMTAICEYLNELKDVAENYYNSFFELKEIYQDNFAQLDELVNETGTTDWYDFTEEEKQITKNAVLCVGLLYKMGQVNLVNQAEDEEAIPTINQAEVEESIENTDKAILLLT